MYQYFAFNLIFSLLIFIYLFSLKTAPFRIRFRLVMLALVSWLIPYDLIYNLLHQQNLVFISSGISEFNGTIKKSIVTNVQAQSVISFTAIFMLLSVVGFVLFIIDMASLKRLLRTYSSKSKSYKKINSIEIYTVKDSDNVFTVGLLKPTIYIGDKYIVSESLPSIIQHEFQHIKNKDQIWLLIITFIQKIFWWNPVVLILSKQARNHIELSCDEMCKLNSSDNSYQKNLAQILLNQHKPSGPLTSAFFGKSKLNIYRIKQLTKDFNMKKHHKAMVFLTAITPFLLLPLVSTSSVSADSTVYDEKGEEIILNENQVDLEYSITLKAAAKDTRKIESRIVLKYGEEISYGQESDIFSNSEFQPIKPTNFVFAITVNKVDEKSVMVNATVTFNNHGEKVESNPSIWVENGKQASLIVNGEDYEIELIVKPTF